MLIEEAATLARAAGDEHVLYRALNILAGVRFEQRNLVAAKQLLLEARELAQSGGDTLGGALISSILVASLFSRETLRPASSTPSTRRPKPNVPPGRICTARLLSVSHFHTW